MPAVKLSPVGNAQQWFTNAGIILSGGKINTYLAGTTTPTATYTDNTGNTPNPNPIILDSSGRVPQEIWLPTGQSYKFVVTDSNNNPIGTYDNISGLNDVQTTNTIPSGSTMLFQQTTVPTGWTRVSTFDDAALRIVGSATPASGGANAFSTQFTNQITTDGHALSIAELASHTHTDSGHTHTSPGHSHTAASGGSFYTNQASAGNYGGGATSFNTEATTNAVAVTINTSTANIQNTGSGTAHSHTMTLNVKYVDVMIAFKN
jgi:hypothetical protein